MSNLAKIIPVFVILALVGLGAAGYFYWQYTKAQKELQTSKTDPSTVQKAAQEETKRLIEEVGRLIALPAGEEPTVATVTDVTKLQDQPFFQKAKNGDKVLIYTNARKAILYDPQAKKVIDVAPINIGTQSAQTAQPKIVLRNGTKTLGLATKVEADLKKSIPNLNVVAKENTDGEYDSTLIVVLNNSFKDVAQNLAKVLDASTSALPSGESKPKKGDILVILGTDRT